jgi:hypothetical protein
MSNTNFIKQKYPENSKIHLDFVDDKVYSRFIGKIGTVKYVDDAGQIHCDFNGSNCTLIEGIDKFHKVI